MKTSQVLLAFHGMKQYAVALPINPAETSLSFDPCLPEALNGTMILQTQ
jgi:hypothetical protein